MWVFDVLKAISLVKFGTMLPEFLPAIPKIQAAAGSLTGI